MTAIKSLAAISLFVLAQAAFSVGQPVLTEETSIGRLIGLSVEATDYGTSSTDGVQDLIDRTGENQTWDITELLLISPSSLTDYYTTPNSTMPAFGDPRLTDANLVTVSDSIRGTWTYRRVEASGLYLMARVRLKDVDKDGLRDTLLTIYDPASTIFPFPLSMGTAWADSSTQTLEFEGSPPVPIETVVATHVVEGWGTLVTPDGMSPALRIRTETRTAPSAGQTSTMRTIRLVAPVPDMLMDEEIYAAGTEIEIDSAGNPVSFRYVSNSVSRPIRAEPAIPLATNFMLEPNYPNPFRAETTIPFLIGRSEHVRISVFDVVGHRTAELLNQPLPIGSHRIIWNAESIPSGIYQIVIETPTSSASRLVVLQK